MDDIVPLLMRCGIPESAAKIMVLFLTGNDGLTTRDIIRKTGICQSVVYDSLQVLKKYGWILDQPEIPDTFKRKNGRPRRIYFLGASPKKMITSLEHVLLRTYNENLNHLHSLKNHDLMQ